MTLLAVDPGASSGWAQFDGRRLVRAGVALPVARFEGTTRIVIEIPQYYPDQRKVVPVQDLISLAVIAGMWIGLHDGVEIARYFPKDWKAQTPKEIGNQRTLGELSEAECGVIEYPRSAKGRTDVLDAIGIGLVHVGRLRRGLI